MNHTIILNRINEAINNLEGYEYSENYPIIIDDLNYIYIHLNNDLEKLSSEERFKYGVTIEEKLMEYFAKLTQKYMSFNYGVDINIKESSDNVFIMASGGYNSKDDVINYSPFGLTINRINRSSYLQTFLHESRHKMQHDVYKSSNIKDIIRFRGNGVLLLKDEIYEMFHEKDNRIFYQDNYSSLYTETDAESFALKSLKDLVLPMYFNYTIYASNNGIKVTDDLVEKTTNVHNKIQSDGLEIELEQKNQGRLKDEIIKELSGEEPISTSYILESTEVDKLIELDKTIKNHPELQEKMPLLKLLFNGNIPKTYNEIINDKKFLLSTYPGYENSINRLYDSIIATNPVLYLTDLVVKQEIGKIILFVQAHPTIFDEYKEEIQNICSSNNNPIIITLLTNNNKNRNKK